ncbi:MAG: cytochrome c biogenesis protein CcsA, partial [Myxococcales bacterium]|nr:cytochrome c biogenesis protein CcsA [Myxococcales bacterium]
VTLAMGTLFAAFATYDYQLAYVASHSARNMDLVYRLAALWGGQAGSLLLWLWMLSAYGAACVGFNRRRNRELMPWVVAILLANAIFFLVLLVGITDPFEKLPPGAVMSDGAGLNPLLQHPAMMIHPLMLYTGLVGFVIPFAFAFAALISGELGTAWFRTTRRWTLFAWLFLSIGIMLGGRWAYEVLGWGGYWAWDPVENASFMPWLPATAYLHSVMIQEKRDMLKTWNLLLIGLTYVLCLFGTFLTRSGVVQSVHAFAQTPIFTSVFLGYVLITAITFVSALLLRRGQLHSTNRIESYVSREASFLLNNWIFIAILGWIFVGTLFPVFTEPFGRRIAVGPAYYQSLLGIAGLALALLLLTGVGPLIAWRRATFASLRRQFLFPGIALLASAGLLLLVVGERLTVYALLAWSLGGFVTATILQEFYRAIRARARKGGENPLQAFATLLRRNQQRYGGYIVHLGAVLVLMGAAGSVLNEERLENVRPGDEVRIQDYRLRYLTAKALPAKHYGGAVARIALYQDGNALAVMVPEKRMYWMQEQPASIPAIYSTVSEDLYVILTAVEADGSATLKLYRNPLVNWIWIGGFVFILGTITVMWPHPRRTTESSAQ